MSKESNKRGMSRFELLLSLMAVYMFGMVMTFLLIGVSAGNTFSKGEILVSCILSGLFLEISFAFSYFWFNRDEISQ